MSFKGEGLGEGKPGIQLLVLLNQRDALTPAFSQGGEGACRTPSQKETGWMERGIRPRLAALGKRLRRVSLSWGKTRRSRQRFR